MLILNILALSTADSSTRLILLILVLIAVILLLAGSALAVMTLLNQRRAARIAWKQMESEKH